MRTGRKQLSEYLEMSPEQLKSLPDRVIRDWLLDAQDSVEFIKKVMRYEDYLAARIGGEEPPTIGFEEISRFLGDHGEHVAATKEKLSILAQYQHHRIQLNLHLDDTEFNMEIPLGKLVEAASKCELKVKVPSPWGFGDQTKGSTSGSPWDIRFTTYTSTNQLYTSRSWA